MIQNLGYLAAGVIAMLVIIKAAPTAWTAIGLCLVLVVLVAVVASLSRDTADLVAIMRAASTLLRGSRDP